MLSTAAAPVPVVGETVAAARLVPVITALIPLPQRRHLAGSVQPDIHLRRGMVLQDSGGAGNW